MSKTRVLALAPGVGPRKVPRMKLGQNQVWKRESKYYRIVQLERMEVQYKEVINLLTGEGTHHRVSKKAFCRLLKGAVLLTQDEVREIWLQSTPSVPIPLTTSEAAV